MSDKFCTQMFLTIAEITLPDGDKLMQDVCAGHDDFYTAIACYDSAVARGDTASFRKEIEKDGCKVRFIICKHSIEELENA